MEEKEFTIVSAGDPSVGIFRQEWKLTGEFHFDTADDKKAFIECIKTAFEYCADGVSILDSIDMKLERVGVVENFAHKPTKEAQTKALNKHSVSGSCCSMCGKPSNGNTLCEEHENDFQNSNYR